MHILIAPNAFKNSLSAAAAADAIAAGLHASRFSGTWAACPIGDGGDGTVELLGRHWGATPHTVAAHDALGRPVDAQFWRVAGHRALIELAEASGLRRLRSDELDPLRASTRGTGELLWAALEAGAREIVLCVGGSATVDGGMGLLRGLGVRFLDAAGATLETLPERACELAAIDMTGLHPRLAGCALTVVCDVTNPLLGSRGAAATFGPQKGASPAAVRVLESALLRFSEVAHGVTGRDMAAVPRGGAAGGVAAGLFGLLGATLVDGIDYFMEQVGFDAALAAADVLMTGEGSIDEQTEDGKGPWGVAVRARARGVFVIGLAGHVPLRASERMRACFDVLMPIGNRAMTIEVAMQTTAENLRRTALELGNLLALGGRRAR